MESKLTFNITKYCEGEEFLFSAVIVIGQVNDTRVLTKLIGKVTINQ